MVANRRRGEEAVPPNYKQLLTVEQIDGLRKLESFGWTLTYVRRPKFEPVEVVLLHSDGKSYARLNDDGSLDQQTKVRVRGDGAVPEPASPPEVSEALNTVDHEPFMPAATAKDKTEATEDDSNLAPNAEPIPAAQKEPFPGAGNKKPPPKFIV